MWDTIVWMYHFEIGVNKSNGVMVTLAEEKKSNGNIYFFYSQNGQRKGGPYTLLKSLWKTKSGDVGHMQSTAL